MAITRLQQDFAENVTASHPQTARRHIPADESDALVARLKELIGGNVSAFSRQCRIRESLLRKYLAGSQPSTFNIVAMADAGNVTVDWLAAGRLPKTRAELRAALQGSGAARPKINTEALAAIIEGTLRVSGSAPASAVAEHCAQVYNDMLERRLITPEGIGPGDLDTAA